MQIKRAQYSFVSETETTELIPPSCGPNWNPTRDIRGLAYTNIMKKLRYQLILYIELFKKIIGYFSAGEVFSIGFMGLYFLQKITSTLTFIAGTISLSCVCVGVRFNTLRSHHICGTFAAQPLQYKQINVEPKINLYDPCSRDNTVVRRKIQY